MTENNNHVAFKDLQKYFFLGITLLLLFGFLYFVSPFFGMLIIVSVIAVDVFPLTDWITKKVKYRSVASLITLLIVLVLIVTPFTLFALYLTDEANLAYQKLTSTNELTFEGIKLIPERLKGTAIGSWVVATWESLPFSTEDIVAFTQDNLKNISSTIVGQTTNLFKQVSLFLVYLIVFFVTLYAFLLDGKGITARIKRLLPIPNRHKDALFERLNVLSKGIVYGVFGAAIVQGFLAGLGFAIAGIGNAAFWGTVMALMSPVPYIGTAVIWVPAGIYLILTNHLFAGVFLLVWGTFVVGLADNFVKPYLIGKSAAINPLLILLTLLGGVLAFGLQGLIFGPFLLTLLLGFIHIYESEYRDVLKD